MTNQIESKNTFCPSLLPRLNFIPHFCSLWSPQQCRGTGNLGCGQFATSLMLMFTQDSSHSSPAHTWNPSQRRHLQHESFAQLFTNCSSVGSFQGGALLQNPDAPGRVLYGITGSVSSPLAPTGTSQRGTGSSGQTPTPALAAGRFVHPLGLQEDILLHQVLPHRLQGNFHSKIWSTTPPSFFTALGVYRFLFPRYSHSSLQFQVILSSFFPPS